MRALIAALLIIFAAAPALAEPGTAPERAGGANAVGQGQGAVVISVRSELFLEDTLQLYFLREGGDIANPSDVIRFGRKQGLLSLGNDTLNFQVRAYRLAPGTYRLIAHGVSCPKIPAENERCLVDWKGILGTEEVSRPSRGYPAIAPTFEVAAGSVTYAGDFVLTARNMVEWQEIPREELRRAERQFASLARAPDPIIPGEYRLKYALKARSLSDDYSRRY